jgi:5-methylthioadenosine/S-adenosylhomocysteine deaminase
MSARRELVEDGLVVVDDSSGRIVAVDAFENRSRYFCDEVYGGRDFIILPGFINTHTHVPMIILQGVGAGLTGFDWLRTIWLVESRLRPHYVYLASKLAIALLLENGVTTFADHYFYEEEVARAVEETGVRAVLAKTVIELSDYAPRHTLEDSVNFAIRYNGAAEGRVSCMIGVHALYSCTLETLEKATDYSKSTGLRIHMHFAESLHEVEYVAKNYSTTPTKLAEKVGILQSNPLLAHAVYLNNEDLEVLAKYKPCVAYSPFTIMSWGQGIARVREMLDRDITVSIATDGPVTDGDFSIFKQIKLALAAQSSRYQTPHAIASRELLKMATIDAAKCLGIDHLVGSIEPGKHADIVVLKPNKTRLVGLHDDPYSTVVMNIDASSVYMTMVNGKILYHAGVFKTIDIESAYKEVVDERKKLIEGVESLK